MTVNNNGSRKDPYQAPVAKLISPSEPRQYIGFWQRVLAAIIDSIVTTLIMLPPLYALFGARIFGIDAADRPGLLYTVLSFAGPAIIVFFFWIKKSATPGKMLINSKIIDANTGGQPSVSQWVVRYFGYFVSCIPLGLGLFAVGWDQRKQGWHDKMAKTVVVKRDR